MTAFLKAQWLHLLLALGAVAYGAFVTLTTQTAWHWPAIAVGLMTPLTPWFVKDASSLFGSKVTSIVGTAATVLLGMLAFYKTQSASIAIPVAAAWVSQIKLVFGGGGSPRPPAMAIMLLAFLGLGASGCATADAIAKDIKSCITPEDSALLKDAEAAFVNEAEGIFLCDPTLAPAALLVCAEDALPSACASVGPDAERLEQCIETTIENDPNVGAKVKARATKLKARAAHRQALRSHAGGAA